MHYLKQRALQLRCGATREQFWNTRLAHAIVRGTYAAMLVLFSVSNQAAVATPLQAQGVPQPCVNVVSVTQLSSVPLLVGIPFVGVNYKLARAGLQLGVVQFQATSSALPGTIISQDPPPGACVLLQSHVSITISRTPTVLSRSTVVPNLIGVVDAQTPGILRQYQLVLGAVHEQLTNQWPPHTVILQAPQAGIKVSPSSAVAIWIAMTPRVVVPDLRGSHYSAVGSALAERGLRLGAVNRQVTGSSPAGTVIAQQPQPGTSVPPGSTVAVLVAVMEPWVVVPNLIGRPYTTLSAILATRDLHLGRVHGQGTGRWGMGIAGAQQPQPGARVARGSAVEVWVAATLTPEPGISVPPGTLVRIHMPSFSLPFTLLMAGAVIGLLFGARRAWQMIRPTIDVRAQPDTAIVKVIDHAPILPSNKEMIEAPLDSDAIVDDRRAETTTVSKLQVRDFLPSSEEIIERLLNCPELQSLRRLLALWWVIRLAKVTRHVAASLHKTLDTPVLCVLASAWDRSQAVKEALHRTRLNENASESVPLIAMTVRSEFRTSVVIIQAGKVIMRLAFVTQLDFTLKAITLEIEKGVIQRVSSGEIQPSATLKCGNLEIAREFPPLRIVGTL